MRDRPSTSIGKTRRLSPIQSDGIQRILGDGYYIRVDEHGNDLLISFDPHQQDSLTFPAIIVGHASNGDYFQPLNVATPISSTNIVFDITSRHIPLGTYVMVVTIRSMSGGLVFLTDTGQGAFDATPWCATANYDATWDDAYQNTPAIPYAGARIPVLTDATWDMAGGLWSNDASLVFAQRPLEIDGNGNVVRIKEAHKITIPIVHMSVVTNVYWDDTSGRIMIEKTNLATLQFNDATSVLVDSIDATECSAEWVA